jgi:hypothetical protein
MPAEWKITFWPSCTHHVFLSHCREDRDQLVLPVFEELERRGIIPWIDQHHYPIARDALQALREGLLACRLLTPAALANGRGWMAVERSFADAIQRRMIYGEESAHVELPLLMVPSDHATFQQSIWRSLIDKCRNISSAAVPSRARPRRAILRRTTPAPQAEPRSERVQLCADTIENFVKQEEQWASEIADRMGQDSGMQSHYADENRSRRVLAASPQRIVFPS